MNTADVDEGADGDRATMKHLSTSRRPRQPPSTQGAPIAIAALLLATLIALAGCCGPKHLECNGTVNFRGDSQVVDVQNWAGDSEDEAEKFAHDQGCARVCLGLWQGEGEKPQKCKETCVAESTSEIQCRTVRGGFLGGFR